MKHVLWSSLLLVLVISSAAEAFDPGERVLGRRDETVRALGEEHTSTHYYPARIASSTEKEHVLEFEDGKNASVPSDWVLPFNWKEKMRVYCRVNEAADAVYTDLRITTITEDTVEEKGSIYSKSSPISRCRSEDPMRWWTHMSPLYRNFAKYKEIKKLPKPGSTLISPQVAQGALSGNLSQIASGNVIGIKKCVTTGKSWTQMETGGVHSSRRIGLACAAGVPTPPDPKKNESCIVVYGFCDQKYLGNGQYGGCVWENALVDPHQIDCKSVAGK